MSVLDVLVPIAATAYLSILGYCAIKICGWLKELKEHERLIEEYRAMLKGDIRRRVVE